VKRRSIQTGVPRAAGAPAWPRYQVATDQLLEGKRIPIPATGY